MDDEGYEGLTILLTRLTLISWLPMDISSSVKSPQILPSVTTSAVEGINTQQQLLERNVEQVADGRGVEGQNTNSQDKALVEQQQIVTAVQANARSLEAATERLGTVINIQA